MHTKISSGKEHRRHRVRRVSVLLVVLALLFTMLPTGLYTVADAAPAEEEPALVPAPEEALPEPEDSMTKEEETDEQPAEAIHSHAPTGDGFGLGNHDPQLSSD